MTVPPGFHIPPPTHQHLGMFVAQMDIAALHFLCSRLYIQHGPLRIAEIGSFTGTTTLALAQYASTLYAIDTWSGGGDPEDAVNTLYAEPGAPDFVFRTFRQNTAHLPQVVPCRYTSAEAATIIHQKLDFVFIDGDHAYDATRLDIETWLPKLRKNRILAGHDYCNFPGVRKAADELGVTGVVNSVWWRDT